MAPPRAARPCVGARVALSLLLALPLALAPAASPSIVLFIGDGMGHEQVQAASVTRYGTHLASGLYDFPHCTNVTTHNLESTVTDSAAAATAIATGTKTLNGRVGVNYNGRKVIPNIAEIAYDNGYGVGLVSTKDLVDATPAAFSAHCKSRSDSDAIAQQQLAFAPDVMLGGGLSAYEPHLAGTAYVRVSDATELDAATDLPLLGLFARGTMSYELERGGTGEPSIEAMALKAFDLLDATGAPFFLMVEGAKIDSAGHRNDLERVVHDVIAFEDAVAAVRQRVGARTDVLVLVTADHETGGLILRTDELDAAVGAGAASDLERYSQRVAALDHRYTTGGHSLRNVMLCGAGPGADRIPAAADNTDVFGVMRYVVDGATGPDRTNYNAFHISYWYTVWFIFFILPLAIFCIVKRVRVHKERRAEAAAVAADIGGGN